MARRINAKLVLELLGKGMTGREIYRTRRMAQQSVKKVREAAEEKGVTWEDVSLMGEQEVYDLPFPERAELEAATAQADYDYVHSELQRDGVTLLILWEEYRDQAMAKDLVPKSYTTFRWALLKNPEDLTARQAADLELAAVSDPRLHRAYLLKEGLRLALKAPAGEIRGAVQAWRQGLEEQDTGVRGAAAQGQAAPGRHRRHRRARHHQREGRGRQQQDQAHSQDGLRVQEPRQPVRHGDAQVLGPERRAAGKAGIMDPHILQKAPQRGLSPSWENTFDM